MNSCANKTPIPAPFAIHAPKNRRHAPFLSGFVSFALCLIAFGTARAEQWRRFDSSADFSVQYPANWHRVDVAPDRLDLMDSENGHQHGVIVAGGHASIVVREEGRGRSLPQTIHEYTKYDDDPVLERREVPVAASQHGCRTLTKLVSKFSPGGNTYQVSANYFCEAGGNRIISVGALYWEHDKREAMYQDIAERMAKSLRVAALSR